MPTWNYDRTHAKKHVSDYYFAPIRNASRNQHKMTSNNRNDFLTVMPIIGAYCLDDVDVVNLKHSQCASIKDRKEILLLDEHKNTAGDSSFSNQLFNKNRSNLQHNFHSHDGATVGERGNDNSHEESSSDVAKGGIDSSVNRSHESSPLPVLNQSPQTSLLLPSMPSFGQPSSRLMLMDGSSIFDKVMPSLPKKEAAQKSCQIGWKLPPPTLVIRKQVTKEPNNKIQEVQRKVTSNKIVKIGGESSSNISASLHSTHTGHTPLNSSRCFMADIHLPKGQCPTTPPTHFVKNCAITQLIKEPDDPSCPADCLHIFAPVKKKAVVMIDPMSPTRSQRRKTASSDIASDVGCTKYRKAKVLAEDKRHGPQAQEKVDVAPTPTQPIRRDLDLNLLQLSGSAFLREQEHLLIPDFEDYNGPNKEGDETDLFLPCRGGSILFGSLLRTNWTDTWTHVKPNMAHTRLDDSSPNQQLLHLLESFEQESYCIQSKDRTPKMNGFNLLQEHSNRETALFEEVARGRINETEPLTRVLLMPSLASDGTQPCLSSHTDTMQTP